MKKTLLFFVFLTFTGILGGCTTLSKKVACEINYSERIERTFLDEVIYLVLFPTEPIFGTVTLITHKPFLYLNIQNKTISRGDGELVVVIPPLWTNDLIVSPMVSSLNRLGFRAHTWEQGLSTSNFSTKNNLFLEFILELVLKHDQKVNLVGWSIGGARAVDFASRHPELVRSVITLGTPFRSNPLPTFLRDSLNDYFYHDVSGALNTVSPNIPVTAIYGLADTLVKDKNGAMYEENLVHFPRENLPVINNHFGLGFSVSALRIIADRLSQEKTWAPYCEK